MRNDAIRQSLSHNPAKAIPFVLHSITTTSSASLFSHQRLPHLSPFTHLFPSPIAFLCPLLSSPISCLACLLPCPSLALHVSCLTPIFPCLSLSFARHLPRPSLTSPVSFLARRLPHPPLPTCVTAFPCLLLSLAHHFLLPVACLAHLLPHPSLPTCVTSHSNDSHTHLTLALTCLFLYRQPLHPSSLVHLFPCLSLALHVPSLTCCFSFLTCLSLTLTHQPPHPSLLALSTPSPISFLSTPLGVSSLAPLFPHLSTCALHVPCSIPSLRF